MGKKKKSKKVDKRREERRARTRKAAEEDQSQGGSNYLNLPEGIEFFKAKKTQNIDIVPYTVSIKKNPDDIPAGEEWYRRKFWVHRNVGADNRTYICPLKTLGKPCPVCEERVKLQRKGADDDILQALYPSRRAIYNVVDLANKEDGVRIFDISHFCFGKLLTLEQTAGKIEYCDFYELKDGFSLEVRWTEEKFAGNTFPKISKITFEERDEDYEESLLEETVDLDTVLVIPPYKKLKAAFLEQGEDDEDDDEPEDDEEEEEESEDEEEEEEGDDEEEDEEEEEDPPPKKKAKPKKKKPEPEPEEDDDEEEEDDESEDDDEEDDESEEEDDEEEEEPPPKKKAKPKKEVKKAKGKAKKGKCPHGHKFAKDTDEKDQCEDCDLWEACVEAKDEADGK